MDESPMIRNRMSIGVRDEALSTIHQSLDTMSSCQILGPHAHANPTPLLSVDGGRLNIYTMFYGYSDVMVCVLR